MVAHRKDVEYNGWVNYETWNCALWLSNEECYYMQCVKYAEKIKNPYILGRRIKAYVGSGRFGDLSAHEMRRVRWEEIAKSFLEE